MQEAEFRQWLQAGGAQTEAGRNSRVNAVKTIERRLSELGSQFKTLAEAWNHDRFEHLRERIRQMRNDARQGGQDFRILMPESEKPLNRLSNWNSWLAQYGRFLAGEQHGTPKDADRIRQYVLEHYIEPARDDGQDSVEVLVSDVNRALGLNQAWPNICQALAGRIFLEMAEVPPPDRIGANQSSATVFRFRLDGSTTASGNERPFVLFDQNGAAFKPVKNFNRRSGRSAYRIRPSGASNRADEAIELDTILEVARAMLVEGLPARVQSVDGGPVNYIGYGKRNLVRYELNPEIAREIGVPASGDISAAPTDLTDDEVLTRFDAADPRFGKARESWSEEAIAMFCDLARMVHRAGYDWWMVDKEAHYECRFGRKTPNQKTAYSVLGYVSSKPPWLSLNPKGALEGLIEAQPVGPDTSDQLSTVLEMHRAKIEEWTGEPPGRPGCWPNDYLLTEKASSMAVNGDTLERLRRRFVSLFPDFTTFADTSSNFHRQEDDYKRALIERVSAAMEDDAPNEEAGGIVLDLIADRSTNLLGYYKTYDHLTKVRAANPGKLEEAAGRLAGSTETPGLAAEAFLKAAWPLLSAGQEASMPYGDSRILPTLILALVRPNEAIAVRYTPFNNAALMLLGRPAFANAPLSAQEFEDMIALARAIERVMRDDWGWKPRDLWDVQGFIWATCQKRLPADQLDQNSVPTGGHIVQPTNLILFGPPGTGKTYATAREAVRLCRPELDDDEPMFADTAEAREDLLREFRRLKDVGQIDFVTFHQSYAYEDFVEGLRPPSGDEDESPSDEGAALRLLVKPGIFRNIVSTAEEARTKPRGSGNFDMAERQVFKMSLGRAGVEDHIYEAALEGNYVVLGWGGELDWSDPKYEGKNAWQAIYDRWLETDPTISPNSGRVAQLWRFRASMKEGDLVVVSWGNKHFRAIGEIVGPYYFEPTGERTYSHKRNVKWLYIADEPLPTELIYAKPFVQASCYLLKDAALKSEGLARLLSTSTPDESGIPDQFALIIDEINRANISKVFGELITLLEPDKRLGMREAVKVRLPYSGKEFGVPANLHIIGTMNTADRSIALLDTALRRRFKFKEVPPEPELLVEAEQATGLPLVAFLRAINDRIEYLLDREHRIGHAYFINCSTGDEVDAAMRDAVIPLLQEYFFEDLSRVAIVLGEAKGGGFLDYREIKDPLGESDARPSWAVRPDFAPDAYDRCIKSAAPSQPAEPGDETSE